VLAQELLISCGIDVLLFDLMSTYLKAEPKKSTKPNMATHASPI
jgi:hypothetical protein